jgi:hypothetical protein
MVKDSITYAMWGGGGGGFNLFEYYVNVGPYHYNTSVGTQNSQSVENICHKLKNRNLQFVNLVDNISRQIPQSTS